MLSGTALTIKFRDEDRSDPGFTCDANLVERISGIKAYGKIKLNVYRRFDGTWRVHYQPAWTATGYLWLGDLSGAQLRELVVVGEPTLRAPTDTTRMQSVELNEADAAALRVKFDEWEEQGLL